MGDCQNCGPFLGPNTGPNSGDPKRDHNFDNLPHTVGVQLQDCKFGVGIGLRLLKLLVQCQYLQHMLWHARDQQLHSLCVAIILELLKCLTCTLLCRGT